MAQPMETGDNSVGLFCPSTFMSTAGAKYRLPGFFSKHHYQLSHLTSPGSSLEKKKKKNPDLGAAWKVKYLALMHRTLVPFPAPTR